jgi:hypothetical protein
MELLERCFWETGISAGWFGVNLGINAEATICFLVIDLDWYAVNICQS